MRIVVGAPAGSAPDIAARLLAEKLGPTWGQPVQVDNRPGAGGMIAMENVRGSPPDGHTLMFAHAGAVILTPKLLKAARYDPLSDFTTLGIVAETPLMIVAAADNPNASAANMLAQARRAPDAVAVGTPEQSSLPFLVANQIGAQANVKFLFVPFNQANLGIQALVKGDLQYYVDGIAPLLPHLSSGRLKAVAQTADRALPGLEGVALLRETLPGFAAVGWFALLGPKVLPADLSNRINHDLNQVLAADDVAKRMQTLSMFPSPKSQAEAQMFLKSEAARWGAVIDQLGLQPQ